MSRRRECLLAPNEAGRRKSLMVLDSAWLDDGCQFEISIAVVFIADYVKPARLFRAPGRANKYHM